MTEREMLELAAKAARITEEFVDDCDFLERGLWNPLTDDGDALRLAVKLKLDVLLRGRSLAQAFGGNEIYADAEFGNDPYAATRRAIVRAAAELGRAMKEEGK